MGSTRQTEQALETEGDFLCAWAGGGAGGGGRDTPELG